MSEVCNFLKRFKTRTLAEWTTAHEACQVERRVITKHPSGQLFVERYCKVHNARHVNMETDD